MFARATVTYRGRARSKLEPGNYLIIHKPDGSVAIHGAKSTKPLNYQNGGAAVKFSTTIRKTPHYWPKPILSIKSVTKKETIEIIVFNVIFCETINEWGKNKIRLIGTERELRDHIADNIKTLLGFKPHTVEVEYKTPYGNIDVYVEETSKIIHIFEVKRDKINLSACSQLERYSKHFRRKKLAVHQYLAAPHISKNAKGYAEKHDQKWFMIERPK